MARLNLFLLGAPRVEIDDKVVELSRRKILAPLVYLALTRQSHRRDTLATLFWPEADQRGARASLRRELHILNSTLGTQWLETDRETVTLAPNAPIWVDVEAFRAHLVAVRNHDHHADEACGACLEPLTAAVTLYQGDFLAGFTLSDCPEFDDWQFIHADELRRDLGAALAKLVQLHRERGEYESAIGYARRWLALDNLHEPVHRIIMTLCAQAGHFGAALRQYEECQRLLDEELGVAPEAATTALFETIRSRRFPAAELMTRRQDDRMLGDLSIIPLAKPQDDGATHEEASRSLPEPSGAQPANQQTIPAPHHNLPTAPTRFIGRAKEMAAIRQLLFADPSCRLLTLFGPGGIGKTRLALEAATAERATFPDGVWLVELAPLSDPTLVPQTIISALGAPEGAGGSTLATLTNYLCTRQALLVLDNCEHLIDTCAHLADALLRNCPQVRLLITSREILGIGGEATFQVPPLAFPQRAQLLALDQLPHFEAVDLFLERARAVLPDFQMTAANAVAIVQVCRWLDGIPLALELAAARVRMLRVEQIAERLDDRFRLLTSGSRTARQRHQTLRALIDWSYDLLTLEERVIFHGLAVFAGGWTLAGAEALYAPPAAEQRTETALSFAPFEVFDLLSQLVNKSLVMADRRQGEETRYRLLETIRQYAQDKLLAAGNDTQIRKRHLAYYLALTEAAAPQLRGPVGVAWLDQLEAEHDNLRVAFSWALTHEIDAALRLAANLLWFWHIRGHKHEGRDWLHRALTAEAQVRGVQPLTTAQTPSRAQALYVAGFLAQMTAELNRAYELVEESLALWRLLGLAGSRGCAYALACLGAIALEQGQPAQAKPQLEEALALFEQIDDLLGYAETLSALGNSALAMGDYEQAQILWEKQLSLRQQIGDRDGTADTLSHLGTLAFWQGDFHRARQLYEESLAGFQGIGNRWAMGFTLCALGEVLQAEGSYVEAVKRYQAGLAFGRDLGDNHVTASAHYQLGRVAWAQGDSAGAAQSYREALRLMQTVGHFGGAAKTLCALGEVAWVQGDRDQAVRHCEEALSISRPMHYQLATGAALYGLAKVAQQRGDTARAIALLQEALTQERTEAAK
ncbi:MAG: tetratricopeptide repeat protein, partial [Caldilineaceae bacterium]|nr:tetratricopeptide repeat protein [Caldilineaceae bacterium]